MGRRRGWLRFALVRFGVVVVAACLLAAPMPARLVERWYAGGLYPVVQAGLTRLSNLTAVAFLDVELVVVSVVVVAIVVLAWRRRRSGRFVALASASFSIAALAAALYVVFLLLWGFNYHRRPLTTRLAFEPADVTAASIASLARAGVQQLNTLHPEAQTAEWPRLDGLPSSALAQGFAAVQTALGAPPDLPLGRPKQTWLGPYFRWAAIDGMTNPFGLEILVNPDALPVEEPMIVAHEWAHLAGYAQEDEASFVGWAACLRADAPARYSGWLFLVPQLIASLPEGQRAALWEPLAAGPRADLRAIADRLSRANPRIRLLAWQVYDGYLKGHRVPSGVASYSGVVALVAGARFTDGWLPRLRDVED